MTTETKGIHTPGAMRAAQVIDNTYVKVMRDAGLTVRREDDAAAERLAMIIDRETHAPEMLEALERLVLAFDSLMPGLAHIAVQDYALINDAPIAARAAIARAKGGQ